MYVPPAKPRPYVDVQDTTLLLLLATVRCAVIEWACLRRASPFTSLCLPSTNMNSRSKGTPRLLHSLRMGVPDPHVSSCWPPVTCRYPTQINHANLHILVLFAHILSHPSGESPRLLTSCVFLSFFIFWCWRHSCCYAYAPLGDQKPTTVEAEAEEEEIKARPPGRRVSPTSPSHGDVDR